MKKRNGETINMLINSALILSFLLIVSGIYNLFYGSLPSGIATLIIGLVSVGYFVYFRHKRKTNIDFLISSLPHGIGAADSNTMESLPIPVAILNMDGTLRGYNSHFVSLFDEQALFGISIEKILPQIKWTELLKCASDIRISIEHESKKFRVVGKLMSDNAKQTALKEDKLSVYLYFIDYTSEANLLSLYDMTKTDIAVINIDNYDDLLQKINDDERQKITSGIAKAMNQWAIDSSAILKKLDRDRYIMLFEHKYLDGYINNKFKILDDVREIAEETKIPVSLSIGIGTGEGIHENEAYARNAMDMALGRGGDQACIKDETQFRFYGGKTKEYEKSTRVKTRAVALALRDFINQSENVVFVGHVGADFDCFGAAIGLQRAVRALGKTPYIIYDANSPAIAKMYEQTVKIPEYKDLFIDVDEALEILENNSLLVVLDTHRPSLLPSQELINASQKTVLIDHHRRSTEFIAPCSLIYHEAYASSTCEMATELIEYMNIGTALTKYEAQCLYTGILMDTKNFMLKTGVRTFDAASYLKRRGLNTVEVKQLFNIGKEDYDHKVDIVKTATEVAPNIAVANTHEKYINGKVIASQAADEMLNIDNIKASFVIFPADDSIGICARSLGDINVHLIMEKLGGGGHMTVAGAQISCPTIEEAEALLIQAINEHISDEEE